MDSLDSYEHSYALAHMTDPVASSQEEPALPGLRTISFRIVIAHRAEMVAAGKLSRSAAANERSALGLFTECFRLSEDSPVSPWLTTLFDVSLKKFEEFATALRDGKPRIGFKTVPSYLTRLRTLRTIAEELEGVPLTFGEVFDLAVRRWIGAGPGRRINHLVEISGAPRRQIVRWRKPDTSPRASGETLALIGKLERALGLRVSALSSHLVPRGADRGIASEPGPTMKLSVMLTRIRFIPDTATLPPIMQEFYQAIEAYKTTTYAGVNAGGRALLRNEKVSVGKDGKLSTWSRMFQKHMNGLLGWLTLPSTLPEATEFVAGAHLMKSLADDHLHDLAPYFLGRGMALAKLTPSLLIDPELLGGYLDWRTLRAGKQSEGHRVVMKYALTLVAPQQGFLRQCPEFACDALTIERASILGIANADNYAIARKHWRKRCDKIHLLLHTVRRGLKNNSKVRDPKVNLAPILDLDDPTVVLIDIIRRHGAARPVGDINENPSPRRGYLAIWIRDELLLRLVTSNPLRMGTLAAMAWGENNQGNLYHRTSGWRLRFDAEDFKNEEGAQQSTYDVPVSPSLSKLIETYLYTARPILLGKRQDPGGVFISNRGRDLEPGRLSEILNIMAMAYFPGSGFAIAALRGHAYRHIIATAWLKSHPGQFRLVAHLLHDTLETVLKNYDHSKPSDGVRAWDQWLSARLPAPVL